MPAQYDTSTTRMLEDEATWSSLYETLKKAVSYWVYTHMVPSWVGQEEDIIEDVIQEALVRTWGYLREREHGQGTPVVSLPQFSKTIAYNYCRDLRRHDCRIIPTRDVHILVLAIGEDPQNIAIERAWEDELFACVAHAITRFPDKQREALLTDLARRSDFYDHPTPLQRAFLHEGIRLEDYQQPPSQDARERNRYISALGTAYKRLKSILLVYEAHPERWREPSARADVRRDSGKMCAQISVFWFVSSSLGVENMSSQAIAHSKTFDTERYEAFIREITHMDKPEKGQADNLEEQDASMILEDPELARLALHLRQTRPPTVDPAYQEALQAKLLETLRAHRPDKGRNEEGDAGTAPAANSSANTPEADTKKSTDEPDSDALEDDTELATLACWLQQTATVPIDPGFQEALQEKLLEVVRRPPRAASKKGPWEGLALKSGQPR